jgi:hypothetical protein
MIAFSWLLLVFGVVLLVDSIISFITYCENEDSRKNLWKSCGLMLFATGSTLGGAWLAAAHNARAWILLDGIVWILTVAACIFMLTAFFFLITERVFLTVVPMIVCGTTILVGGCILGWWFTPPGATADVQDRVAVNPQATTLETWKNKLADWKEKQVATEQARTKLDGDKEELVLKLGRAGVNAPMDLKTHPQARIYAEELQEVVAQIDLAKKKYREREEAIERMESAIRRYERITLLRGAGIDEQDLTEIGKTIAELEVKLAKISNEKGPAASLELEVTLEKELQPTKK